MNCISTIKYLRKFFSGLWIVLFLSCYLISCSGGSENQLLDPPKKIAKNISIEDAFKDKSNITFGIEIEPDFRNHPRFALY